MTSAPDISDNDSETLSNISDENMCCVCKKLSLDAVLLLYTVFCPASEKKGPIGNKKLGPSWIYVGHKKNQNKSYIYNSLFR